MKKILVAILLVMAVAAPAFAAKKPKKPHVKYDYRYRPPKTKAPKTPHHVHAHSAPQSPSH